MNKYTVLVDADKLKTVIPIPHEFEHQKVEVVVSLPVKRKLNPRKYRGLAGNTRESIDQSIRHIREEWNNG